MIFDDCTSYPLHMKMQKIHGAFLRWAKRSKMLISLKALSLGSFRRGMYTDLRTQSLESLMDLDFDGMAVVV